ncbi:hypothetical protein B1759_16565 [Rubrivirga sp. SAORIC476]|nr:hypothetical protein B1759_16565 [Rubrivirga sp. SAORIC476]
MRLSRNLLHRPSHVSDRLLAAALFGGAACLLAVGFWAVFWADVAAFGAAVGVPAAAVIGALAAPRLAAHAATSSGPTRAARDGAAVAIWAYVLGAFALAVFVAVTDGIGFGGIVRGFALGLLFSLGYGAIALVPALILGAGAGWLFYVLRTNASPAGAV